MKSAETLKFLLSIGIIVLLLWGCTNEDNPANQNDITGQVTFDGNLVIKTDTAGYYWPSTADRGIAFVAASLYNSSSDTFYSRLGDAMLAGIDHDNLLMAEATNGYFEKKSEEDNWEKLDRLILFEGSKVIRLLPETEYTLYGNAYIRSDTSGTFRLRIEYFKTLTSIPADTLQDTSNTFFLIDG